MHAVTEFELLRSTNYFTKLSFQKTFDMTTLEIINNPIFYSSQKDFK